MYRHDACSARSWALWDPNRGQCLILGYFKCCPWSEILCFWWACEWQNPGKKADGSFGTHSRAGFLIGKALFSILSLLFTCIPTWETPHSWRASSPKLGWILHPNICHWGRSKVQNGGKVLCASRSKSQSLNSCKLVVLNHFNQTQPFRAKCYALFTILQCNL